MSAGANAGFVPEVDIQNLWKKVWELESIIKQGELMEYALDGDAYAPTIAHADDGGYDIRTPMDCSIFPGKNIAINTRLHLVIPQGCAGLLVCKSGLNVVDSVTNSGLIDCGYTGSIRIKLYNLGDKTKSFKAGDKVAQIVIFAVKHPQLREITMEELRRHESERGDKGFGSSGR